MAQVSRETAKGYFTPGALVTEQKLTDLLDSMLWFDEEAEPPVFTDTAPQRVTDTYLSAVGLTGDTAIKTFVETLENGGVYSELLFCYLFMGSDYRLNLVDPETVSDAGYLTHTGTPTSEAKGMGYSSGEFSDTHYDWSLISGSNNVGGCYYLQDAIQTGFMGSEGYFKIYHSQAATTQAYININGQSNPLNYSGSVTNGFHLAQRKSNGDLEYYQGSTLKGTSTIATEISTAGNILLNKVSGDYVQPASHTVSFAAAFRELNSTKVGILYNAVQTLMAAKGRSV